MRKWLALSAALFISGLSCFAQAQAPNVRAVIFPPRAAAASFTPSCTESSNFIARTSGLDTFHKTNYDALICGLVTDGVWAKLDAFYVSTTADTTTANLNLVNSSFPLTQHGAVTFTADVGYTGDASTGYFSTGYVPSTNGTNYTLNSASFGACHPDTRAAGQTWASLGTLETSRLARLIPNFAGTTVAWGINDGQVSTANANAQGLWVISRTGATTSDIYKSSGTSLATDTGTSISIATTELFVLAENNGSGTPSNFSGDKTTGAFFAGGFSSANVTSFRTRFNTYMSAYSVTGC